MRTARQLALLALLALPIAVCSVGASGKPVPPPPSDFAVGATVPGWILRLPGSGRGEVAAASTRANGRWSVILSRAMRPRPRDVYFSFAIMDDGIAHAGKPLLLLSADPAAIAGPESVACRAVPNAQITPDGVMSPGEWDMGSLSPVAISAQNDLPTGQHPAAMPGFVTIGSAYDDEYIYFVFRWTDPSTTQSDLGPLLEWNGSSWTRRPHRANDVNGNGLLDGGETNVFSAPAEDEDRLAILFPIHDATGAFKAGGGGCATSCHQNLDLDPSGTEAVHAWQAADDRTDVWTWRAASTAPARTADDRALLSANFGAGKSGGGSGFLADGGASPFVTLDPASRAMMFANPPAGHAFLVQGPIAFGPTTEPGFPVIPPVPNTAAPYDGANFNASGSPPAPWAGVAPFFANDYLPGFVQQMATGSRADVETGSSFSGTQWTVEFRRRRITRDAAGAPRTDDVIFDEDAPFRKAAFDITTAALGLPFSVSLTDRAAGHGTRESLYPGPLRLSRDESLAGPVLGDDLVLHDYGPGFAPASEPDFADPRETKPAPSSGTDLDLRLKAGTDGGETLFVLVEWNDAAEDLGRDRWTFDGFYWNRGGFEDELRMLWNSTVPRDAFVSGGGCAYLCHAGGGPFGAPSGSHFSTSAINELVDVWRWEAGRSAPLLRADDQTADWRFFDQVETGSPHAAIHGDGGLGPLVTNSDPGQPYPLFMASGDPNANAPFLTLDVPGSPHPVIPFRDVLGNRPPAPSGGSVSFSDQILPIFTTHCTICHPPFASMSLLDYAGVIAGGQSGLIVLPGNPAGSLIMKRLTGQIQPQMPYGGPYLSAAEVQLISDWIAAGAQNN